MYISEDRSLVEKEQIVLYILFQKTLGILFQRLGHLLQLVLGMGQGIVSGGTKI